MFLNSYRKKTLVFLVCLLTLFSCRRDRSDLFIAIPYDICQNGDLVFRRGISTSSMVVLGSDKKSAYSHVGILLKDGNENCYVIHAVPDEAEETGGEELRKKELLTHFWKSDRSSGGAIVRFPLHDSLRVRISEKSEELFQRKLLFDHRYNLCDTTTMYCTELVWFIYQSIGVDLTEQRYHTIPGFSKKVIFPSEILRNQRLETVFQYSK